MQQVIRYDDSKTRYFLDTEFYEDGSTIDLISLALVCSDGREYYAVNAEAKLHLVSDWVREHVLPSLPTYGDAAWNMRHKIMVDLIEFTMPKTLGEKLEFYAYYADYDWVVLCQLFGSMMNLPKHFPKYCMDLKQLSVHMGNPTHPKQEKGEHNALEDARWNAELYKFLRALP